MTDLILACDDIVTFEPRQPTATALAITDRHGRQLLSRCRVGSRSSP